MNKVQQEGEQYSSSRDCFFMYDTFSSLVHRDSFLAKLDLGFLVDVDLSFNSSLVRGWILQRWDEVGWYAFVHRRALHYCSP
jgi:hypothetical protein